MCERYKPMEEEREREREREKFVTCGKETDSLPQHGS